MLFKNNTRNTWFHQEALVETIKIIILHNLRNFIIFS